MKTSKLDDSAAGKHSRSKIGIGITHVTLKM